VACSAPAAEDAAQYVAQDLPAERVVHGSDHALAAPDAERRLVRGVARPASSSFTSARERGALRVERPPASATGKTDVPVPGTPAIMLQRSPWRGPSSKPLRWLWPVRMQVMSFLPMISPRL
jgi:hypothetical protein